MARAENHLVISPITKQTPQSSDDSQAPKDGNPPSDYCVSQLLKRSQPAARPGLTFLFLRRAPLLPDGCCLGLDFRIISVAILASLAGRKSASNSLSACSQ